MLAVVTATVLALSFVLMGTVVISLLTSLEAVRETAIHYLPYAIIYVLTSFAAFQLDGIFIGTTQTVEMRNAALMSAVIFFAVWWPLTQWAGNAGLWITLTIHVIARALTLLVYFPALRRSIYASRAVAENASP